MTRVERVIQAHEIETQRLFELAILEGRIMR